MRQDDAELNDGKEIELSASSPLAPIFVSGLTAAMKATCRIFLACGNDIQFRGLCNALGKPELAADERFKDNAGRVANRDALTALITPTLADRDGEELCKELLMSGLPAGPVLAMENRNPVSQSRRRK